LENQEKLKFKVSSRALISIKASAVEHFLSNLTHFTQNQLLTLGNHGFVTMLSTVFVDTTKLAQVLARSLDQDRFKGADGVPSIDHGP